MLDALRRSLPHPLVRTLWRAAWLRERVRHRHEESLSFRCNLCGHRTSYARSLITREGRTCGWCGSSLRFRAVMDQVSRHVMGEDAAARDFPVNTELSGLGFSDTEIYARYLRRATDYTNSWFHRAPRRDLMHLASFQGKTYDFLICSEVLEHVNRPVEKAFENLYALLRPGGVLVLSVPTQTGATIEHFPEMTELSVKAERRGWSLQGRTLSGEEFKSTKLTFHGGPGSTLEMRIFGRESIDSALREAGFVDVSELLVENPGYGLVWHDTPEAGNPPGVWVARKERAS